jgi:phosphoribosylanthranilate isomerase
MHKTESQNTKIKICGIFRQEDTGVLNETLPDYAGFVFAEKSPRYVTAAQAKALRNNIDPRITSVGVFVDADPGFITELVREGTIGAVQLHGNEDAAYVHALKKQLRQIPAKGAGGDATARDIPIIQAVTVHSAEDVSAGTEHRGDDSFCVNSETKRNVSAAYPMCEDIVLLDHGAGGTGKVFDHSVLKEAAEHGTLTELPFFVAGGLNAENVSEILALLQRVTAVDPNAHFLGVDVSGGVETDGVKDPEKIRRFVAVVRCARNGKEEARKERF